MKARIFVTKKPHLHSPQDETILRAVKRMGFDKVTSLRMGWIYDVELGDIDYDAAKTIAEKIAEERLTDGITEEYEIKIRKDDQEFK